VNFHAFNQPTLANVNRWGQDNDNNITVIASGEHLLLGFYLQRDKANKLQVVYVDRRGHEFPTAMGFYVTFPTCEGAQA
jgi:hypothetical protein